MEKLNTFLFTATILVSQSSFASEDELKTGEQLYKTNCAVCHGGSGDYKSTKRVAPPIAAVRMHYINTYSDKDSFIQAITEWVEKPEESNTLMKGAIRKFNIMPQLAVPTEDSEKIAAYIFEGNIEKPKGFEAHIKEKHGKNFGNPDKNH